MLTDTKLKNLKPQEKAFKLADRDGLYITVLPSGTISFRYNYRINGRQETVVLGKYGDHGISLKEARERLAASKKMLEAGGSPARQKARERTKVAKAESFGEWAELWLKKHKMAESTRDMRRSVFNRDLLKPFGKLKMWEITHENLRELCDQIVARGAPATAVHAREIVLQVYRFAIERGHRYENPATTVSANSIATFEPRDRALSPDEIQLMYEYLDHVATMPTIRLGVKMLLLTMLRKGELIEAEWGEVNFTEALWTIPAARMKRRNPHNVYLSKQALDILIALRTCSAGQGTSYRRATTPTSR